MNADEIAAHLLTFRDRGVSQPFRIGVVAGLPKAARDRLARKRLKNA